MSLPSIPAYELKAVYINGNKVEGRPVQWDGKIYDGAGNDENGRPVKPITWVTTCPTCGNMVQFSIADFDNTEIPTVSCPNCAPEPQTTPQDIQMPLENLIKLKENNIPESAPALDLGPPIKDKPKVEVNIPPQKELNTSVDTGKKLPHYTPKEPQTVKHKQESIPQQIIDANKKIGTIKSRPEAPKPEAPKPEAPKPEAPKPEAPKPEAPKPEAPKPEAPKPEAPKPEEPSTFKIPKFHHEVHKFIDPIKSGTMTL